MNRTAVLLTALALGAFPAGAALAQLAPASNAPIDVTADQLLAQNQQCVATWKGAVEARQGTSRLRADTLSIYEKVGAGPSQGQGASLGAATGKCGSDPEKLVADGSVYYATPQEVVKGDHAVYLAETKTITVTGDVVISQGKNVIVGNTAGDQHRYRPGDHGIGRPRGAAAGPRAGGDLSELDPVRRPHPVNAGQALMPDSAESARAAPRRASPAIRRTRDCSPNPSASRSAAGRWSPTSA